MSAIGGALVAESFHNFGSFNMLKHAQVLKVVLP